MLLGWSLISTAPLTSWSIHLLFLARLLVSISSGWGKCCVPPLTSAVDAVRYDRWCSSTLVMKEWLVHPVWCKFIHNVFTWVSRVLLIHNYHHDDRAATWKNLWPATSCWRQPQPETVRHIQQPPWMWQSVRWTKTNSVTLKTDSAFLQNTGILNHYTVHNTYRRQSFY